MRRGLGERRQMRCSADAHVRRSRAGCRLGSLSARVGGTREIVEVGALLSARMLVNVHLTACAGTSHWQGLTVRELRSIRCAAGRSASLPEVEFTTPSRMHEKYEYLTLARREEYGRNPCDRSCETPGMG